MKSYIYGAGGHGKVVLDAMRVAGNHCDGFVDDKNVSSWMGLSVLSLSALDFSELVKLHLAIGSGEARQSIVQKLQGVNFFSVVHPAAAIADSARIGEGTLIAAKAVVAPSVRIGVHCIINHSAVVDHDCVVGDFSHIGPLACLGGSVEIGKNVLVGAGAVILPGVKIADFATVGAGAVVTKNVGAATTVIGNPAKKLN